MSNSSTSSSSTRYVVVLLGLIVGAVAIYAGAILATAGVPPEAKGNYWTAYFLGEKRALAGKVAPPRVMIYGSSSSFFGIKATKIAAATGLPTVNMATHGGNGVAFTFAQALAETKPGDIAIILIDASTLMRGKNYIAAHGAKTSYALDMEILKQSSPGSWPAILSHISLGDLSHAIQHLGEPYTARTGGYWKYSMNQSGDMQLPSNADNKRAVAEVASMPPDFLQRTGRVEKIAFNRQKYSMPALFQGRWHREIARKSFHGATEWVDRIRSKGARVFLGVPPSVFDMSAQFQSDLEAVAGSNAGMLDLPEGLPVELMFDTANHVNGSGADLSTARLILSLCSKIDCTDTGEAESLVDTFGRFMALTAPKNFGRVIEREVDDVLQKVRWIYGPTAAFAVYAPERCTTRIDVTASAVSETRNLSISSEGKMLKQVAFDSPGESDFSFTVPPAKKSRKILWEFDGWRDVGTAKQVMLMSGMRKVVECKG